MTPETQAERGEQARRLLEDALLTETLDAIEQEWTQAWQNSPVRDAEGREAAWRMLKSAQKFRKELELTLETGRMAQATLAQRAGAMLKQSFDRLPGR